MRKEERKRPDPKKVLSVSMKVKNRRNESVVTEASIVAIYRSGRLSGRGPDGASQWAGNVPYVDVGGDHTGMCLHKRYFNQAGLFVHFKVDNFTSIFLSAMIFAISHHR